MEEKKETTKSETALREEIVLQFWRDNKTFEKSSEKESPNGEFVFFEGPPTANAKPALHHLEARAFKDVIPRYKTMQGYHVRRKAGWDTHGLPVELQIEKKLGLNSKKEIEKYGVAKFNKECKDSVHEYIGLWKQFSERMAFSVDFDNAYYTYDNSYIESLWNIVDHANKKGLMYKDYKIVPWCARCGTALSSHELAQEYKDIKDLSVIAKFPIVGFPKAYFLAWTTTPWTLPGNVALAVGADVTYVEAKVGEEIFVLAKDRLSVLGTPYEIIAEHKGNEMAGMQYEKIYDASALYSPSEKEKILNAHKIYVGDFVTTTDGTGIVHIAPMYGADDFDLATKNNLPKVHTVDTTGIFLPAIEPLSGRFVKDENFDIDIIKDLAHRGLLFKKEKYEHNYPHCWRCKTPLLYYARDSWYFAVSKIKDKLIASNENISWEPSHIKEGRFGEWLRGIKDWAISRERYWGTPLPVWQKADGSYKVVGSLADLKKYTKKSGNNYFVMRHGETEANKKSIICSIPNGEWHLDADGIAQAGKSAESMKDKNIDLIFTSDFIRTLETAEIMREKLGLGKENVIVDERLREMGIKSFDGKNWDEYHKSHIKTSENFNSHIAEDESYQDVKNRMTAFVYEVEEKYKDKNILFVTHGGPAWLLFAGAQAKNVEESLAMIRDVKDFHYFQNAEIKELDFVPLPHNDNFELDFHKPYIDQVVLEDNGEIMTRTPEVMDVWFDSGAMPYAQDHFPFEGEKNKPAYFPADFISEAIDQTRGWFYTLVAVAALFDKETPVKNIICLGHLLDAQGQKMSKSKGNVIDPWEEMNKWGADTVRMWMYSVTSPGDSKNYDEKVVRELHGKIFTLFGNILSFYELYRDKKLENNEKPNSQNVLDQWILLRLEEFTR
ncbi:MAG: class I tRNA ligase family protein, partial [Patescibacteria group bacterium]